MEPLHLPLRGGEELHEAGEGTGGLFCHNAAPFLQYPQGVQGGELPKKSAILPKPILGR